MRQNKNLKKFKKWNPQKEVIKNSFFGKKSHKVPRERRLVGCEPGSLNFPLDHTYSKYGYLKINSNFQKHEFFKILISIYCRSEERLWSHLFLQKTKQNKKKQTLGASFKNFFFFFKLNLPFSESISHPYSSTCSRQKNAMLSVSSVRLYFLCPSPQIFFFLLQLFFTCKIFFSYWTFVTL